MKRRLLILFVLTVMFVSVLVTGRPAEANCQEFCASNWRDCMAEFAGTTYERYCDEWYTDCMCSNCGACPRGGPPWP